MAIFLFTSPIQMQMSTSKIQRKKEGLNLFHSTNIFLFIITSDSGLFFPKSINEWDQIEKMSFRVHFVFDCLSKYFSSNGD